ncbi:hypothetical protein B0H14DRAFT_2335618, partial [Mycena olivaceomarginata]
RIGEKFYTWTDEPPSTATILDSVSLYWLISTFPMSIYAYRRVFGPRADKIAFHAEPENYVSKFFGFSWFLRELAPVM